MYVHGVVGRSSIINVCDVSQ